MQVGPTPVPGPRLSPWLLRRFSRDPLGLLTGLRHEFGTVVRLPTGLLDAYLVTDPASVSLLLTGTGRLAHKGFGRAARDGSGAGRQPLRRLLGDGLLTAPADLHRSQRRLLSPLFAPSRLSGYAADVVRLADAAVDGWLAAGEVEVHRAMTDLTLAVVARTLFSAEVDDALATTVRRTLEAGMVLLPRARLPWAGALERLPAGRAAGWRQARAELDREVLALVARRRAATAPGDDLLGRLVGARDEETGDAMSDRQVRDEVVTLLLAGFETTANALTWAVLELGRHPDVRARLAAEVDRVGAGAVPAPVDLPVTGTVLAETLRLHPPAWLLVRRTAGPLQLPTGHALPAGATVLMPPWLLHRDPAWWRDPAAFDPTRWADATTPAPGEPSRPRSAYLPFGAGPRQCIGNTFALLEATLALATVTRRVHLDPPPGLVVRAWPSVTLRPRDPVPARVVARVGRP